MSVPDEVQAFLRERVETFEQLESLLLLFGERQHNWSVEDVAARTKMSRSAVETALGELRDMGLVEGYPEGTAVCYRLSKSSADTEAALAGLLRAYQEDTLEVMKLMSRNSIERLRTAAVRRFAEAFVLLRKKKDG